jgi:hypothetical protein
MVDGPLELIEQQAQAPTMITHRNFVHPMRSVK